MSESSIELGEFRDIPIHYDSPEWRSRIREKHMMLIEPCLAPNGESAEDLGIRSTDCAEFFQAKLAELLPDYSTLDIEIDGAVAPGAKYHRRNSVNESGLWDAIAPETKERYGLD